MRAVESLSLKLANSNYHTKTFKSFNTLPATKHKKDEKYLLSFFEIFKNRAAGEKMFSYLQRLGLIAQLPNGKYMFVPKTRSSIMPIVCLYKTLNDKGYLKRMTQTEAGYYFLTAFGRNVHGIRLFYADQLDACCKYDEYFFHIPQHSDFIR